MDNKDIAKLAEISYIDNRLDGDRVSRIVKHLSRPELREYFRALKRQERKLVVYVDSNFELSAGEKKKFEELYPGRRVIFRIDESLVFGVRITEDDIVTNLNMKSSLEALKGYLNKSI